MIKHILVLWMAIVLSVSAAYAAEENTMKSVSPAPLLKDNSTGIEMVFVKGGCFQMGDIYGDGEAEEKPVHEVCVDDFYLGKYEVRQDQWKKIMGSNPSLDTGCGDDCPVENVSWNDVQVFISKLNSGSGTKYRLPTEAEFEYAARSGGKVQRYAGGNDVDSVAWFSGNAIENHPVGTKAPNGLGIYDLSGNVWEWTNDWYGSDYYKISPRNNPKGPDAGVDRVKRGGCFSGPSENMRVSRRSGNAPEYSGNAVGFRLLLPL